MNIIDRLLQGIKQIKPKVEQSPISRNQYLEEFANEPHFVSHQVDDYKVIAFELWKILDDIEKAEVLTPNDTIAYRSIVKELAQKRFVYLKETEMHPLEKEVNKIILNEEKEVNKIILKEND